MSTKLNIAAIGGSGPKATAVQFLKDATGVRQWSWIANPIAAQLRPGMSLTVEQVSTGKVETSYTDATGTVVALKVPRQQLFLGGSITVEAPEAEVLAPVTVTFAGDVAKYASAYDAKQATATADDAPEAF